MANVEFNEPEGTKPAGNQTVKKKSGQQKILVGAFIGLIILIALILILGG